MITSNGGYFSRQAFKAANNNLKEASETVESIITSEPAPEPTPGPTSTAQADVAGVVAVVGQYARRVRLLTWAVVAMAIVLIMKEVD